MNSGESSHARTEYIGATGQHASALKIQCVNFGLIYDFYIVKGLAYCPLMHK